MSEPLTNIEDAVRELGALPMPAGSAPQLTPERLAEILAEGKQAGEFPRSLDPVATAATVAAVLQGGYVLARAADDDEPFDQAVRGMVQLLRGVAL